jgi:hypothetical protein
LSPDKIPTPIPTLPAAHLSAAPQTSGAGEFNKCQVHALDLIGAWVDAGSPETDVFTFTDINNVPCQATFEADVMPLFSQSQTWFHGALSCTSCHNAALADNRSGGLDMTSYAAIQMGSRRESAEAKGTSILGGWKTSALYLAFNPTGDVIFGHPTAEQANTLVVYAGSPVPPPTTTPVP